jgi:hypothetical protein
MVMWLMPVAVNPQIRSQARIRGTRRRAGFVDFRNKARALGKQKTNRNKLEGGQMSLHQKHGIVSYVKVLLATSTALFPVIALLG